MIARVPERFSITDSAMFTVSVCRCSASEGRRHGKIILCRSKTTHNPILILKGRRFSVVFRTVPERFRNIRKSSASWERKENHTLTVRKVARLFEATGVVRTERSIINWCQPNKMGGTRLNCHLDRTKILHHAAECRNGDSGGTG